MIDSSYVEWLKKQGIPLFKGGGIYWRLYKGALVPAPVTPCFVKLSYDESKELLRKSGAYLLRYSSDPCEQNTQWWYIVCDSYDLKNLTSKMRNQIKRGNKLCTIKQIDVEWLANHGYECYFSAFSRYKNARPVSMKEFRNNILATAEGPFEYWGVFVDSRLVGYCQCIIECDQVATNVIKFDPAFLKYYSSYAFIDAICNHYVVDRNISISNGTRSILHDTNMQDFLLKFGFKKQFCRLNVMYRPSLKFAIQILFQMRKFLDLLPDHGLMHKLKALLYQEELRRACNVL
jgi:hypothetical protein